MGSLFGGGGSGDAAMYQAVQQKEAAQVARDDEGARQERIRAAVAGINNDFTRFNDDFYTGRGDAYTAYARPQLDEQYGKQREALTYALSRGGLLNSSVAAQRMADLRTQYDRQRQAIVDQGMTLTNQARADVDTARTSLVNQATTAADPSSIAGGAASRVESLSSPLSFSPLGTLFAGVTTGLRAAANQDRTPSADAIFSQEQQRYGVSDPGRGTARVVRTGT